MAVEARSASPLTEEFLTYLRFEKGLADNTIAAYTRDLAVWQRFCSAHGIDPDAASSGDLTAYMGHLRSRASDGGSYSPASVARMLVSLRGFHRFLVREGHADADPTAKLGSPKKPRSIPKAIALEDVERLLELPAPDPLGRRDRAILETLYGAGLRISELVGLDVDDIDLDEGSVLVRGGKGGKSRRVPVGRAARTAVGDYLTTTRPELVRKVAAPGAALFLNARGDVSAGRAAGRSSDGTLRPRGWRTAFPRTPCATRSPRTCSMRAPISGWCRTCWGTQVWPRPRSTRSLATRSCGRSTTPPTREPETDYPRGKPMDQNQLDAARTHLVAEKEAVDKQLLDHGVEVDGDENVSIENHEGFADAAQVTAERSQQITLVEQLRTRRSDILDALKKIDEGTYGKCESCGKEIPFERLEAVPAATLCVDCKQQEG